MFKKLAFKLPSLDISKLQGNYIDGYSKNFKNFEIKDIRYLTEACNKIIRFHIPPFMTNLTIITGNGVNPHTDHLGISLNYYLNENRAITYFYKLKPGYTNAKKKEPVIFADGPTDIYDVFTYEPEHLDLDGLFISQKDTAYLMNVKNIHAVKQIAPCTERIFIRWMWQEQDFEEVLNSIEIL